MRIVLRRYVQPPPPNLPLNSIHLSIFLLYRTPPPNIFEFTLTTSLYIQNNIFKFRSSNLQKSNHKVYTIYDRVSTLLICTVVAKNQKLLLLL